MLLVRQVDPPGHMYWQHPELTAAGRLPMHSLPHPDRLLLDGTWRFQLLPRADAAPSGDWREVDVPGCWTMQDSGDFPRYTNVVMPFPDRPPRVPDANPTGLYRRLFELPRGWRGRRVVLHFGGVEGALHVVVNGEPIGIAKDARTPAEFDVTELV